MPIWSLEWSHGPTVVHEELFSWRIGGGAPQVVVGFRLENAPKDVRLAVGIGRRPNVHYWDDRSFERMPLPFLTCEPDWEGDGLTMRNSQGDVVLKSPHVTLRSFITSRREIEVESRFTPFADGDSSLRSLRVRVAPPDETPVEVALRPENTGTVVVKF